MFALCVWVMLLCLQCGRLSDAVRTAEMVSLVVEFGRSAILPCNGSTYLEEEGSVQWEVMGEDVAILRGGEPRQGDKFQGRVQLPSEAKLGEGDWSVVLHHTTLSDSDMYECILRGRKTISTVWLTVMAPRVERSLVVPVGDTVDLACYIEISRSQSHNHLQIWWTRNGSAIISTPENLSSTFVVSNSEDMSRIELFGDTKGEFRLKISPTMMRDNGEYHCFYKIRESDDPRPGIPESITLTVLETTSTDIGFRPDETEVGATDLTPVLLEDFTQPIKVMTESQLVKAFEETETSFPDEGSPETSAESFQWDTLAWVRIGLITGVLLLTAVVLCIVGALGKL